MAEATSKRESDGGDMDRISGLPDSVLLHILSFLPTKTCVSTMSLVSRRWRHLWEQLQVFDFSGDYDEDDDIKQVKKFAFFVNAVLTICRSHDILKMRLNCGLLKQNEFSMIDFVNLWVRAAIGPRLEELHLMLPRMKEGCSCVFSESLFNCSNLVSLSLRGAIELKVQHSWALVHFPSLKNLYLDILSVDSIDDLLTGCPILETLYIIDAFLETLYIIDADDNEFRFRVPPSVKRLKYKDYSESCSTYIDINAPYLEYLSITTKGTFETAIGNLQNVMEAYIDVSFPDDGESVNHSLNLLGAISGTKHLTLCSSTTKLLQCAPIPDFPVFRCLLHLSLQLPCFNSKLLAKVLENCHVLQDLVICSDEKVMPLQLWEPESTRIHNCLVSHLTSIHIKGYGGFEDELSFVEYILRNALVLKTIIIKPHSSMVLEEKFNILKKLINIPRGCSDLCQFEFD